MRLRIRTHRWNGVVAVVALAGALGAVAAAPVAADERGEQLYALCQQCHGAEGAGKELALAPAIAGMPEWYVKSQLTKFRDGLRGTHFDDIAGMRMRPMSMWLPSEEDVAAVSAYVAQMPPQKPERTIEGGDATKGATLFTTCIACHAADGSGNEALGGAPLKNQSDWYLAKSIKKYRTGVRGSDPRDQTGALMRAMSQTLTTDELVADVIAHIRTLDN